MHPILNVLLLSIFAGLGTGIGGALAVIRRPGQKMFGFLMGMASGVMISLSFLKLVAEAWELSGYLVTTAGFAAGAFTMLIIDMLTPHIRFGVVEQRGVSTAACDVQGNGRRRWRGGLGIRADGVADPRLIRTGLLMAVGISIHNAPEGIAIGASYMHSPQFGVFLALAMALHNIPEGIATALPLCAGGACRMDSFRTAFLSGLVEPLGALAAAFLLTSFRWLIPAALAFAGGVMVFLTLDELVPAAREHGHQHATALGSILGTIFVLLLSGTLGV